MGLFKGILIVTLLGLVGGQEVVDVFRAYSPGQYGASPAQQGHGGVYRANTPRLVPIVKVRSSPPPLRSYSKQYFAPQPYNRNHLSYAYPQPPPPRQKQQQYQQQQEQSTQSSMTYRRHVRVRQSIPYDPYKSGQPVRTLKRIRVVPSQSPYGSVLEQPVQFSHTVPAVSTYKVASPYAQQATLAQNVQPSYYVPRAPHPQQIQPNRPLLKAQRAPAKGEEQLEDEYPSDANPQYNFAFDVKDDDLTNYQNRQESRDNGVVKGSYSVVDPDGYVRTVTYEATPKGGFQAKVTREPTDVKIKFPVPTEAPEQKKSPAVYSPQGQYQQPQYQQSYNPQPQYASQRAPQYAAAAQSAPLQPQYVARRYPSEQQGHRLVVPRYSQ